MYMTMRRSGCPPGQISDVLSAGVPLIETMKERFGVDFGVSINLGGDPDVIGLSAAFESLGGYQDYRAALAADQELSRRAAEVMAMTNWNEDRIGRVLHPPGPRADFAVLNQARMHMPMMVEAVQLGLEIAEFVERKVDSKTGFMTSTTGDRSVVAWVGRFDSLDEAAEVQETLEADPEYLDFFKRSGHLFVDGSLEQTIWQRVV